MQHVRPGSIIKAPPFCLTSIHVQNEQGMDHAATTTILMVWPTASLV